MHSVIFLTPTDDIPLFKLLQHDFPHTLCLHLSEWQGCWPQNVLGLVCKLPDDNILSLEHTHAYAPWQNTFCMSPWWIHLGLEGPLNGYTTFSWKPWLCAIIAVLITLLLINLSSYHTRIIDLWDLTLRLLPPLEARLTPLIIGTVFALNKSLPDEEWLKEHTPSIL